MATTPREALTYGNAGPGTFDARAIAGATLPYSTTYQPQPGKGNSLDYFIRVPKAGTYKLILNGATNGTNEQLVETNIRATLHAFEDEDHDGTDDHGGADDGPAHD